jgi:hypothetical protein
VSSPFEADLRAARRPTPEIKQGSNLLGPLAHVEHPEVALAIGGGGRDAARVEPVTGIVDRHHN